MITVRTCDTHTVWQHRFVINSISTTTIGSSVSSDTEFTYVNLMDKDLSYFLLLALEKQSKILSPVSRGEGRKASFEETEKNTEKA